MCGRYALHANPEVVALQFGLDAVPELAPRYNIAPATEVLIVRGGKASLAHWGLRRKFANLRAETLAQKFPGPYRDGRVLVPASGFYEWQSRAGSKQPYYFSPADGALLALAAVCENDTFSLITTEPNATLRNIHDRMPVIIARGDYAAWLAGENGLLRPAPDNALNAHPVGMAVNRAANDSAQLIEPVELPRGLFD
ncbi:MAG TPA: SOS response-associated peptidase [Burkholderiales bacterium]|jgi:putative SOS response-associated peptidase YedK|nr:SOS response-associated peptidase [Burkholderiales bacterium]